MGINRKFIDRHKRLYDKIPFANGQSLRPDMFKSLGNGEAVWHVLREIWHVRS